jgi:Mg/Co/Ni transporter MgtE
VVRVATVRTSNAPPRAIRARTLSNGRSLAVRGRVLLVSAVAGGVLSGVVLGVLSATVGEALLLVVVVLLVELFELFIAESLGAGAFTGAVGAGVVAVDEPLLGFG